MATIPRLPWTSFILLLTSLAGQYRITYGLMCNTDPISANLQLRVPAAMNNTYACELGRIANNIQCYCDEDNVIICQGGDAQSVDECRSVCACNATEEAELDGQEAEQDDGQAPWSHAPIPGGAPVAYHAPIPGGAPVAYHAPIPGGAPVAYHAPGQPAFLQGQGAGGSGSQEGTCANMADSSGQTCSVGGGKEASQEPPSLAPPQIPPSVQQAAQPPSKLSTTTVPWTAALRRKCRGSCARVNECDASSCVCGVFHHNTQKHTASNHLRAFCQPLSGKVRRKRDIFTLEAKDEDDRLDDHDSIFLDRDGTPLACPCNHTYISYACCGSDTGLLWEPASRKLGELSDEL